MDDDHADSENRHEIIDLTSKQETRPPKAPMSDFENFNNGILPASFCYRAEPQVANCRSGLHQQQQHNQSQGNQSHLIPKDAYFHDISERRGSDLEVIGRNRQPLPPAPPQLPPPPPMGLSDADLYLRANGNMDYYSEQCHDNGMMPQMQQYRPRLEYYHVYNNHGNQMSAGSAPTTSEALHKEKLLASKKYTGYTNLMEMDMEKMAISSQGYDHHMQVDRESNNDSGYSTKLGGSSHGPSPSLSGNQVHVDLDSLGPNFNLNTHPMSGHYSNQPAGPSSAHYRQQPMRVHHQIPSYDPTGPYIEGFNGTSSLV